MENARTVQHISIRKAFKNERERALMALYGWRRFQDSCFSAALFDLIAKADMQNLAKLRRGFPDEVQAYFEWRESSDEAAFLDDIRTRLYR